MKFALKLTAWFIVAGAIGSYIFFMATQSASHVVSYLIPNLIATLVFAFYCYAGIRFLKNPEKTVNQDLLVVVLLLQSLLIDIGGFVFKNLYFPAFIYNINLKNLDESYFQSSYFTIKVINGYFQSRDEAFIGLNIIGLVVLMLCLLFISAIKKKRDLLE